MPLRVLLLREAPWLYFVSLVSHFNFLTCPNTFIRTNYENGADN